MGKGIAKQFKSIFPQSYFAEYRELCMAKQINSQRLHLFRTPNKWALSFPTKRHWKQKSFIEDIEEGLGTFRSDWQTWGIESIAFPQLGCGNGELDWENQVRPLMEERLGDLPIRVHIHIYDNAPTPERLNKSAFRKWISAPPALLTLEQFRSDLAKYELFRMQPADPESSSLSDDESGANREEEGIDGLLGSIQNLDTDGIRAVWKRLVEFGYVSADELSEWLGKDWQAFRPALTAIPYIDRASFASDISPHLSGVSTWEVLSRPESQGIRLVGFKIPPPNIVLQQPMELGTTPSR